MPQQRAELVESAMQCIVACAGAQGKVVVPPEVEAMGVPGVRVDSPTLREFLERWPLIKTLEEALRTLRNRLRA